MNKFSFLIILCLIVFSCKDDDNGLTQNTEEPKSLILVSLDGFRHDYFDFTETPALDQITIEGIKADALLPVFPTKTFPNHYTLVTGLYPENHGIVSNTMFDPDFNEIFTLSNGQSKEGKWYEGEPIWVTAEQQGLPTATYFWPGSDAEINGVRPTQYRVFDSSVPYANRTQQILDWLDYPVDTRPRFMTLYFESPDSEGHGGGPTQTAASQAIKTVDGELDKLLKGITEKGMDDLVDVIIVSDHGMSQLSRDSMIFLDDYIDLNDVGIVNFTPIADLVPEPTMEQEIYDALANAHPKMRVFKKGEAPAELHYNNHRRIMPLVCIAEDGWSITTRDFFNNNPNSFKGGAHGYDPKHESMWGIFLAKGPSFKVNVQIAPFENIDLYELMCKILEVTPAPNDGGRDRWGEILK